MISGLFVTVSVIFTSVAVGVCVVPVVVIDTSVVLAKVRLFSQDRNTPDDVSNRGAANVRGIAATSVLCVVAGAESNVFVTRFWLFRL